MLPGGTRVSWTYPAENDPHRAMADRIFRLHRRELLAGTFLCDLRLLGDGQARALPARPLIVAESDSPAVDREQVFLIEDWRLRPDGSPIAPGLDPGDAPAVYTVNGQMTLDIPARI